MADSTNKALILYAPDFSDQEYPTIIYSNPLGNRVTSLQAAIYDIKGGTSYAGYREISKTGTSYTFYLTDVEKVLLQRATVNNKLEVRFYIKTVVDGETHRHYSEVKTFSLAPIIRGSVIDKNDYTIGLTGDDTVLVKYYSNALAKMTAEGQNGAALNRDLFIIRNGANTGFGIENYDGTNLWWEYPFENVEDNIFTFSAEDEYGCIGKAEVNCEMVDYIHLTCNLANNIAVDGGGNVDVVCSGDCFGGDFGAAVNKITVQCRYRSTGGYSDWVDMEVTKYATSYYARASFEGLDYTQTYYFEAKARDYLEEITSAEKAFNSKPLFHWSKRDFVFETPVTFKAGAEGVFGEGDQTITGNLRLKGDGNFGNALYFGDGSYCHIAEREDDVMTIKADRINLEANGVYAYGYAIPHLERGEWIPYLNSAAVSSYVVEDGVTYRRGWYMKMGQIVTVGFYIKANCNSGYSTTDISISTLPFTPMFAAAGGGMCSGAYVVMGQNFQCFVAETDGKITTRSQLCNATTATNLTTSSSAFKYPNGGGVLTLSGTITFMANS